MTESNQYAEITVERFHDIFNRRLKLGIHRIEIENMVEDIFRAVDERRRQKIQAAFDKQQEVHERTMEKIEP